MAWWWVKEGFGAAWDEPMLALTKQVISGARRTPIRWRHVFAPARGAEGNVEKPLEYDGVAECGNRG